MYDLGDTLPFSSRLYDAPPDEGGGPVNAVDATLTITLPDGTSPAPVSVSPSAIGVYQHDHAATAAGRYLGRWLFTMSSGATTAHVETFDVRPADPGYLVGLGDVKAHLNIPATNTTDDEELRAYIEATTRVIEDYRNEVIARRTIVEHRIMAGLHHRLLLRSAPVLSLTSIALADGSYTWNPLALRVADAELGAIEVDAGPMFHGRLTATYVAGYAIIPANFTLAAKIIIGHLWSLQRQPSIGGGAIFGSDTDSTPSGLGFAIPNRAVELLGGRPPVIA